ncbi:hypothetical protein AB0J86_27915 [Micromonospora sp. NPDC049559]|uniref:trypsin-like serine peptidase n=1 Tax=Micromonospora sp. NPDC049559 TaxID=3155923 RepID=UPI003440F35F
MRHLTIVVSTSLAVLSGLVPAGAPARADTTSSSGRVATAAATFHDRPISDPDTAQALAEAYWTPERMRAARPVPLPEGAEELAGEATDRPGRVGEPRNGAEPAGPLTDAPLAETSRADGRTGGAGTLAAGSGGAGVLAATASPGVGKVFFTDTAGEDWVCSGGTINNPTANLVSTAGHCVHGGRRGTWHKNWVYVPYYDHGAAPYGVWAAKQFTSVAGWTDWSFLWWDFAFVNVWPRSGKKLVHTTGGHGISFNQPKQMPITLLGYPSAPPFDGQWQQYCQGTMKAGGAQRVRLGCPMTQGSSGGPFLQSYSNTIRFGFVNSVISHGFSGDLWGPYFEEDVADVYDSAKNFS